MHRIILGALICALLTIVAPAGATPTTATPATATQTTAAPTTQTPTTETPPAVEEDEVLPPNTETVAPHTGLYYNDPCCGADPPGRHVSRLYVARFNGAESGTIVRVMTWIVTDDAAIAAMKRAYNRGVHIRVLTSRYNCEGTTNNLRFIDRAGSWVHCIGHGHGMHQKSITFERTGGVNNVVLVGSSNMADSNWQNQWNDMFQFVRRPAVYDWYKERFDRIYANRADPWKVPYETFTSGEARANFLPIRVSEPTRSQDPTWDRLNDLPVNPGGHATGIRIAMFAMDHERGDWLVEKLINMHAAGANIKVLAGPSVRENIKAKLREELGAENVMNGYERVPVCSGPDPVETCNFVHLKMMTARYWADGAWQHRSYTGSENWSMDDLRDNFEVTQQLGGLATWESYQQLFNMAWRQFAPEWD